ncbi:MAG: hypothetical protein ACP5NS_02300 [Candidatus Pacearchaeota archaeon]
MAETILSSPIISEAVLPFILIFTVVFAILQKSGILGKDKKQIDALVALVVGLITITFANAVGIINSLLPFLAVSIVLILIFLILVAMVSHEGTAKIEKGFKITIVVLSFLAVIIAGLIVTGAWDYILYQFEGPGGSTIFTNIVFLVIIIGAFIAVYFGEKKKTPTESK